MALTLLVVVSSVKGIKTLFNMVALCSYMTFQHLLQLVAENTRFQLATPDCVFSLNFEHLWSSPFMEVWMHFSLGIFLHNVPFGCNSDWWRDLFPLVVLVLDICLRNVLAPYNWSIAPCWCPLCLSSSSLWVTLGLGDLLLHFLYILLQLGVKMERIISDRPKAYETQKWIRSDSCWIRSWIRLVING
jgi:hypothetical protein